MNRRGFLASLLGGAAALTLDPERALWVPGKKLISIPLMRVGNVMLTPAIFARLVLTDLKRELDAQYSWNQVQPGIAEQFQIRKPRAFA